MVETITTKSKLYPIGVVLIVSFCLLCGFWNIGVLYLFGLPLVPVFVGIILVWISSESVKNKILVSLMVGPAIAGGFLLFYLSLPKAEPETFLLPAAYRGPFVVLFVEGCGARIPYDNGRRIYNIPATGVLLHSGKRVTGVLDRRFFLVGPDGTPARLPKFDHSSYDEETNSLKWRFARDELTRETLGVFWGYTIYESFTVTNHNEMERQTAEERTEAWKRIQQTIDEELARNNCRR